MELTRKQAAVALCALMALFALRMSANVGAPLRSVDEAHTCVVAARLVAEGGPLYGNAITFGAPVPNWLAAGVFRLCGLYSMAAWRVAAAAWWAATALAVYGAARTMLGRAGSLAAATAFLIAATNPGFQDIRPETLAPLPIALAVGLCVRGLNRREATSLVLAGAAAAMAFLTKQQTGPLLGVVAAFPLIAWAWRRSWREAWRAICASALVVAGFTATVAGVWLLFAARGAGHAFFYCVWSFNWSFLRHSTPAGGYLPTPGYLLERVARFAIAEPFMPLAVAGAVVGLAGGTAGLASRVGPPLGTAGQDSSSAPAREDEAVPWRAKAAFLALLLGAMWLVASPANKQWLSPHDYVSYVAFLYVPMALLVGVCAEVAVATAGSTSRVGPPLGTAGQASSGTPGNRGLLLAAAAGVALGYLAIPALRPVDSVRFCFRLYVQIIGVWQLLASAAAIGVAGWLLGGRRMAWLAPLVWLAIYVGASRAMGWEGGHLTAALCLAAIGLLWRACERRSIALVGTAGLASAGAFLLSWSPQVGTVVGVAAWLLLQERLTRFERWVFAGVFLVPTAVLGVSMEVVTAPRAESAVSWSALGAWFSSLRGWLMAARLEGTLALCGVLLAALPARGLREGVRRVAGHRIGLLAFAGVGALLGGIVRGPEPEFLTSMGMAAVMAAALTVSLLCERDGAPTRSRVSLLLASGCLVAALAGVALGSRAPDVLPPRMPLAPLAACIEPGSRAYVWGGPFESEIYVRARAVPAAPQLFTWMLERVGTPPLGTGLYGYPSVATLANLDQHLSEKPPAFVVVMSKPTPSLADLPRFGPILRTRYRLVLGRPAGRVYRLAKPAP